MLSFKRIFYFSAIVLMQPHVTTAQHTPPSAHEIETFAERARKEAHVGKPVSLPEQILQELVAQAPDDCLPYDGNVRNKLEAHQLILRPGLQGGVAIQGRSFCYCSATGNCAFWIYQLRNGKYRMILETDMVQIFGFLKSRTHGYPDLVTWSHGSATERSAELFRFDGDQYIACGGWEEEYGYLDQNNKVVTLDKPRITSHFWGRDALPTSGSSKQNH